MRGYKTPPRFPARESNLASDNELVTSANDKGDGAGVGGARFQQGYETEVELKGEETSVDELRFPRSLLP